MKTVERKAYMLPAGTLTYENAAGLKITCVVEGASLMLTHAHGYTQRGCFGMQDDVAESSAFELKGEGIGVDLGGSLLNPISL